MQLGGNPVGGSVPKLLRLMSHIVEVEGLVCAVGMDYASNCSAFCTLNLLYTSGKVVRFFPIAWPFIGPGRTLCIFCCKKQKLLDLLM